MATLEFVGLDELMLGLVALPDQLVGEATAILRAAADGMMAEAAAAYPVRTGNLRWGLKKTELSLGRYGVAYQVANTAPHAWIFENGTEARHVAVLPPWPAANFGPDRGRMPPGHVFIPAAERHRAQMYRNLSAMVERESQRAAHAA
jgi:hypothetical protein